MTDIRQSQEYSNFMIKTGWKVDKINKNYVYIKNIPLLGKFIKIQRPSNLSEEFINKVQKKHKPFQIIIEPNLNSNYKFLTKKYNFQKTSPYLPSKTIQIDLTQSKEKLLSQINKKTRYAIRYAQKHNVSIKKSTNINEFSNNWHQFRYQNPLKSKLFSQKKQIIALYNSFKPNSYILNAIYKNKIIANVLLIISNDIAYYFYTSADKNFRTLNAPSLLVWESILLAKSKKAKIFDFEGIYDDRFPSKNWQGFTHFKKSFGGEVVKYPGAYKYKKARAIF